MSDTPDPKPSDTPDPSVPPVEPPAFSWKNQLSPDFANSPTMQKYADTKDGFNDAVKAHLELQKMMGHDKVPIPKGPDDPAMVLFKKAMKIPDTAEGYGLTDVQVPENMNGVSFDKGKFAEALHKFNLTPYQAKGLWGAYTEMVKQQHANIVKETKDAVTNATNLLRSEWGDAYQSKVELGQLVINKFSDSQEMNDFVTAVLVKDPRGVKFLAKIGEQFAENKIGDFRYQRHSQTPEEIQREIDLIVSDLNHPYNNPKALQLDHDRAVDYVNTLRAALNRAKTR